MAGYNYGAGNFQRLREAVCCSLILSTSFCVLWSILIVIFTSPIISCFGKDETMQEIARIALRANTIMFFTFGFQFVYSTLYMAIGRARQSLLLNIGRQGLFFIPIILLLPSDDPNIRYIEKHFSVCRDEKVIDDVRNRVAAYEDSIRHHHEMVEDRKSVV